MRSCISAARLLEDTSCRAFSWTNPSAVMAIIIKQMVCSVFIYNRKYENGGKWNRVSTKCTNNCVTKQRLFPPQVERRGAPTKLVTTISDNN